MQKEDRLRRVLLVSQAHHVSGGMELWLSNFAHWLEEQPGWDVNIALPRGRRFNDPEAYCRAHSYSKTIELDVRVGTHSARVRALATAIARYKPDILIPIGSAAAFDAVAVAKARGSAVRFLPAIRGHVPALAANVVDLWPVVDGVVTINRLFYRFFRETLPAPEWNRIHYVRHGAKPASVARTSSRRLRVGYVGRVVEPQKRASDLIAFAAATRDDALDLHVFGDGAAAEELRQKAPWCAFHGHRSQAELYRAAYPSLDVLVLFSENEGTPNVVCEAMQHGVVPVIARYLGEAGEEVVQHERNGFTFPVGNVNRAVEHVRHLVMDRALLESMSGRALQSMAGETDERMHRDWLAVFERTLALPQKTAAAPTIRPSGRLGRLVPSALADGLRAIAGRHFPHRDGWAEWPGSVAVAPDREEAVAAMLTRMNYEAQARLYSSS